MYVDLLLISASLFVYHWVPIRNTALDVPRGTNR